MSESDETRRQLSPGDPLAQWGDGQSTCSRGASAEREAEEYLVRRGYQIEERNVRTRGGEIDLVAVDGDTLCFVEVKARSGASCGSAIEAITPRKQRRMSVAAALYVTVRGFSGPCRFDVVTLDRAGEEPWRLALVKNAFECFF